jgi:hypothetical protein
MFPKSFVSILIVTSSFILAIGQTPEAKQEKDKAAAARTFAFAFDGDGGYLGVQATEVSKDNFAKYGLRDVRGVAVEKVVEDSPAASAGIKEGDVILRLNGEEITSTRKLSPGQGLRVAQRQRAGLDRDARKAADAKIRRWELCFRVPRRCAKNGARKAERDAAIQGLPKRRNAKGFHCSRRR